MTVKTYDQLIASFPNNSTGLVKPVDIRNLVDSVELKYDNYTVVKPGQPTGNKFPDPVAGEIILPDDTVWVINGEVTVSYPIVYGNNVTIIGISGSYINDQLLLDGGAGAVALINSGDIDYGINLTNIALGCTGSGRIFDIVDPSIAVCSGVIFYTPAGGSMGSVDFIGSAGDMYFVDRCIMLATVDALQITGDAGNLIFDGVRSGFANTDLMFDLQGTATAVFIRNCYNDASFAMFQVDEATTSVGVISNNGVGAGKTLVTGVDNTSVNWTFNGNSGIQDTVVGASLNMNLNTTATTNPGLGVFGAIVGNSNDTIGAGATRFERTGDLELTYTGNDRLDNATITLATSIKRASGSGSTRVSVGIWKNGELVQTLKNVSLTSITHVTTTATATLAAAFPLVNGMEVTISGADQPDYNGTFTISNVAGLAFDYTMALDPGANATGTLLAEVPIQNVLGIGVQADELPVTLHVQTSIEPGDTIVPVLRPDASGAINFIAEDLFLIVQG